MLSSQEYGDPASLRFVIDDRAFRCVDNLIDGLNDSVPNLVDLLLDLREQGEIVGILSGWGNLAVTESENLSEVLGSPDSFIDRDLRLLLLGLLGKCRVWDEDPSIAISDEGLQVDGTPYESLGVLCKTSVI